MFCVCMHESKQKKKKEGETYFFSVSAEAARSFCSFSNSKHSIKFLKRQLIQE